MKPLQKYFRNLAEAAGYIEQPDLWEESVKDVYKSICESIEKIISESKVEFHGYLYEKDPQESAKDMADYIQESLLIEFKEQKDYEEN